MTKSRFIENVERKKYVEELDYNEIITFLKLRLNMVETKCSYKRNFLGKKKCYFCNNNDKTEHLLECPDLRTVRYQKRRFRYSKFW